MSNYTKKLCLYKLNLTIKDRTNLFQIAALFKAPGHMHLR